MSIIVQHPKTFGFVPGELLLMAEIDGTHLHNPFTGPSSLSFFHRLSICSRVASPCKIIWVGNLMFCRMLFYSAVLNHRCRWTGIINYHFIRNVTGCSNNRTPKKRIEAIKSSVCQDGLIFKNRGTLNHHKYWSHFDLLMVDKETTRRLIIEQLNFHPLSYSDKHFGLRIRLSIYQSSKWLFCLQRNHKFKSSSTGWAVVVLSITRFRPILIWTAACGVPSEVVTDCLINCAQYIIIDALRTYNSQYAKRVVSELTLSFRNTLQ